MNLLHAVLLLSSQKIGFLRRFFFSFFLTESMQCSISKSVSEKTSKALPTLYCRKEFLVLFHINYIFFAENSEYFESYSRDWRLLYPTS